MDKIKEKLEKLRLDADAATARADKAESEVKVFHDDLIRRENEVSNLNNKIILLQEEIQRNDVRFQEMKLKQSEGQKEEGFIESLQRKITMLEEAVDEKERARKEAVERTRELEMRAEAAERKVKQLDAEKSVLEGKVEQLVIQHDSVKAELALTLKGLEDL